ncbi:MULTISPECIES: thiamine diphosphokinase [unclassified Gemella]|uniref:thiamine diphosphokinase n=1 Tax=unclassified Gemella TaxID=2624949 RepID=UPI001073FA96|nr:MULTISPECIES: thiamine diphosphokinase [unclassified Gemella]MBF0709987.1 thiamine diphosphokinase [Gemella sp. GL1.1]MBF0746264.1 thiamine diphosphokinase [Gemella sp. 19428wG2_WT2a]NYS27331.1 thiamine diphosphokinase [Gemella sp. GL1]TFU60543.1 thiamine diphosphokinase [Gemella sp. WT2a]
MKINLMLGGEFPKSVNSEHKWVGVDSGVNYLLKNGIEPNYIIGDLDSIDPKFLKLYPGKIIKKLNQDMTDAEYALNVVDSLYKNVEEIDVYGATGGRLDHFFANILLLNNSKFENKQLKIIDDNNIIFISGVGKIYFNKVEEFKYISFVPLQKDTVISILGSKYEVIDYELSIDRANATSNEFIDEKIEFITNKKCLIIYSKDK